MLRSSLSAITVFLVVSLLATPLLIPMPQPQDSPLGQDAANLQLRIL